MTKERILRTIRAAGLVSARFRRLAAVLRLLAADDPPACEKFLAALENEPYVKGPVSLCLFLSN